MIGDNALGDFLRARRGRLRVPATATGRRRVPGLRREELAGRAGVSAYYLTRLEQGIDRNPSEQVLRALAAALELGPDETAHLFALAAPPAVARESTVPPEELRELLDAWTGTPAYARNRRLDVLAANPLAVALSPLYTPGRNLARGVFLDPAARALFPDWAEIAAQTVAALRAEAGPRDPAAGALVASLLADDDFRALWERHDVRPSRNERKRFRHPVAGPLTLRRQSLAVAGAEDCTIVVYQAAPGSADAAALAALS